MAERSGNSPGVPACGDQRGGGVQPGCPDDFFLQWEMLLAWLESRESGLACCSRCLKTAPLQTHPPHSHSGLPSAHSPTAPLSGGHSGERISQFAWWTQARSLSLPSTPPPEPPSMQEPPCVPMTRVTGQVSDVEATEMSARGVTTATQDSGLPWPAVQTQLYPPRHRGTAFRSWLLTSTGLS